MEALLNDVIAENSKTKVYLNQIFEDFIKPYFNENDYSIKFESDAFSEKHIFTIIPKKENERKVSLNISLTDNFAVNFTLTVKEPESKNSDNYKYLFLYELDSMAEFKENYLNEFILAKMLV